MHKPEYPGIPDAHAGKVGSLPPYVEAALFLLCGAIMGSGLTVFAMNQSIERFLTEPEHLPERLLGRMDQRLDLSPVQAESAARIIHEHFETFDAIRRGVQPEIDDTLLEMRNDLAAILSDEQRVTWEKRFDEVREKWRPGPLIRNGAETSGSSP